MFEKVNPCHPDKVADRIAGAVVDLGYAKSKNRWSNESSAKLDLSTAEGRQRWAQANPKVAVEVLLGHGKAAVMIESSEDFREVEIEPIVRRLAGDVTLDLHAVRQDALLAGNQEGAVRCGDNGIFRGCAPTYEQKVLTAIAASMYERWPYDGKYIIGDAPKQFDQWRKWQDVTICQSHATEEELNVFKNHALKSLYQQYCDAIHENVGIKTIFNPLGEWTGGPDVDCGAVNRKLGSDMGEGVTGGGLHGKDLSKGDVSINIACYLKAVQSGQTVTACCSIGDEQVTFVYAGGKRETETFADIVEMARLYILTVGGFEKFSEWGLIRPNFPIE